MKSTEIHPFLFFDNYFNKEIYSDYNDMLLELTEKLYFDSSDIIEKTNEYVIVNNVYHQEDIPSDTLTFKFNDFIENKITSEIQISKQLIEKIFLNRMSDGLEIDGLLRFLKIKLESYRNIKAFNDFKLVGEIVKELLEFIKQFKRIEIKHQHLYSFTFLANTPELKNQKLNYLYNKLTEKQPLIFCTKIEFLNAFSGKEIENGIHWLVKGKSKVTSKVSLFYFMEELISHKFISPNIIPDLNKYVQYIFRDCDGNELKNLKQSKSTISQNTTQKDRIDSIISQL